MSDTVEFYKVAAQVIPVFLVAYGLNSEFRQTFFEGMRTGGGSGFEGSLLVFVGILLAGEAAALSGVATGQADDVLTFIVEFSLMAACAGLPVIWVILHPPEWRHWRLRNYVAFAVLVVVPLVGFPLAVFMYGGMFDCDCG